MKEEKQSVEIGRRSVKYKNVIRNYIARNCKKFRINILIDNEKNHPTQEDILIYICIVIVSR